MVNVNKTSVPLKYVGGKSFLSEKVGKLYEPYRRTHVFVELFAGGLGLSFSLKPDVVLANDINKHLINFYHWLREDPKIQIIDTSNEEEVYYKNRSRFNELIKTGGAFISGKEMAELFYYLNRCGYNGLYRVNRQGLFNTPFGRYKYSNCKTDLSEYSDTICNWNFTSTDFENISLTTSDFVFCDPPYDTEFTSYTEGGFRFEDQIRLMEYLKDKKCPIVYTNQATERMVDLVTEYGYKIEYVSRPRNFRRGKVLDESQKREIFATRNL